MRGSLMRVDEAKNPLGTVRRRCPGKHSEADKPTEGSAVSQEAAG